MSIEAIGAIGAAGVQAPAGAAAPAVSGDFGAWFSQEVAQVNHSLARAEAGVQALAAGQSVSLHQVMINLEEAKLSFDLLAQIRNRVLESYQEVMRTQV